MPSCDVLLIGFEEVENLGLRYLAAFLVQGGASVKIAPCDRLSPEQMCTLALESSPRIVGFSMIFQRMLPEFADLVGLLRSAGVKGHFTMGGHFPTVEPSATLTAIPGLDSIVRCEGEETLRELLENVDIPRKWPDIRGIAFRQNGHILVTPPRPLIRDLDALPFPLRTETVLTQRGIGVCCIIASRGCFYNCSFCSIQRFYAESSGPKRRSRSPGNVAEEMLLLHDNYGIRVFIFDDDDMSMQGEGQRQWLREFSAELRRLGLGEDIVWRISCRVDDIHKETLSALMQVGLRCVYIGIESGNGAGLATYNKHYTPPDIARAVEDLRSISMPFEFGFMLLNPDSTFASVREDVAFLKKLGAEGDAVLHFTKMLPYAGTPIAERLKREGRLRGGIIAPDYPYQDDRLELLQLFLTQAFHIRNFDEHGSVERLRHAKFDLMVASKYFLDAHAARTYAQGIRELTRQSNEQCLQTLSMGIRLMECRSESQILDHWPVLQGLVEDEVQTDREILRALDSLMISYRCNIGG